MKGVVLAGGEGTRLRPLTYVTNKSLLPIYNKPVIYYPVLTLRDSGIKEIVIVSHRHFLGTFIDVLGDGSELGVKLSYVVQDKPKGLAHGLGVCEPLLKGERIAMILGDNIFEENFKEAVQKFSLQNKGAMLILKREKNKDILKTMGVPQFKGKKIVRIEEKPTNPKSNYIAVGMYLYDHRVFDIIKKIKPSSRGEYEITDLNNFYVAEGTMSYTICTRQWFDVGTFDSLLEANIFIAKKEKKR